MAGTYSDMELSMGNQRMRGNLSKISSYYALANFRIRFNDRYNIPFSALGIIFYNDQEGKYLSRNRLYLTYAWHTKIFRETNISGGLSIGAMNYSVKGTPLSGDGSDIRPDATAGFQVYRKSAYLGISVSQLFNSEVQPLEEITVLSPYINIDGGIKLHAGEKVWIKPTTSIQFPLYDASQLLYRNRFSFNVQMNLLNKFGTGIGLHNNEKMVLNLAVTDIFPWYGQIDLQLCYAFPIRKNSNLSTPLFEIGIVYNNDYGLGR
jgi:hypothetical protein